MLQLGKYTHDSKLKVCVLFHLQFACYNGTKIAVSQVCDFVGDCKDHEDEMHCGDCNFQFGELF